MGNNLKEHPKVLALVFVSVLVLGGGLAYAYWPEPVPPMPETIEDVSALLESKSYANLSREQKRPYVERVSELMRNSDREQRRAALGDSEASRDAMRDMFRQMMTDRAKQFAMASPAERQKMIQEDLARFANRGGPGGRGGRGEGGERGGERQGGERSTRPEPTEEEREQRREERENRIEQWVNEGNGQEAALMREYWHAIRQARENK